MDHQEIETRNLVDLYLTHQLGPEDSSRFEEHFVDCPICLDRIEEAERFQKGLSRVAQNSSRPVRENWRWAVAAAILFAFGMTVWQATRAGRLQTDLDVARATAAQWKNRYEKEVKNEAGLRRSSAEQPLIASTFILNTTRSGGGAASSPANRIPVPAAARWVVLSLDRDWEPGFESLRATLEDSASRTVWQQEGLGATPGAPLSVVLPSALLPPGDYGLRVEGKSPAGPFQPAGRYRFRIFRP